MNTRYAHHRAAWTLTEMMVAMSIIILLASLILVARRAMLQDNLAKRTTITLNACSNALAEYEITTGKRFDPSDPIGGIADPVTYTYPDRPGAAPVVTLNIVGNRRFTYAMWQVPSSKGMLEKLVQQNALIIPSAGATPDQPITDAWGFPIYFTHRVTTSSSFAADARFRLSPDPIFVSAGQDNYFGDVNAFMDENLDEDRNVNGNGTGDGIDDSTDNLYAGELP